MMLVWPPLLHGSSWWTWHRPGGQSQPSAVQPPCSMPRAMRWASEWKRRLRPRSRTFDFPSRTAGMTPAAHAVRRASTSGDLLAGVELGCLQSAEQGFEGHRDHDGGVHSAGLRQCLCRVGLDVLLERQPHPVRRRLPGVRCVAVDGGWCLGAAFDRRAFFSIAACREEMVNFAVARAVAVVVHPEHRSRVGGLFFLLQQSCFVGVGGGGVDDFEDPLAQDPQRLGVVIGSLVEQPLLRLRCHPGLGLVR